MTETCQVCGTILKYDEAKEHVHDTKTGELVTPQTILKDKKRGMTAE